MEIYKSWVKCHNFTPHFSKNYFPWKFLKLFCRYLSRLLWFCKHFIIHATDLVWFLSGLGMFLFLNVQLRPKSAHFQRAIFSIFFMSRLCIKRRFYCYVRFETSFIGAQTHWCQKLAQENFFAKWPVKNQTAPLCMI